MKMKHRILFLVCILATLFLTGCGTEVTSKMKFNQDGSGVRTISALISGSDAKNLDGGFYELDTLLQEAAPEGVSIARENLDNGDAIYEFDIIFSNIDEYNQKVSQIIGKTHEATWLSGNTVFSSDIKFSEEECSYDLVKWAIDAFKDSKYAKWTSNFTAYGDGVNEIYYQDKLVFSGKGNPEFEVNTSPKVKTASMYSEFKYDGTYSKRIELQFEPGALDKIDIEQAKTVLAGYTQAYKIDMANSMIRLTLENDEVNQFILSADLQCKEENLLFTTVVNPFQKRLAIHYKYNLGQFFSLFELEYPYIYDYIKLPDDMPVDSIAHTSQINDVEVPEGYQFAGAFRYDNEYELSVESNTMVEIKGLSVNYVVDKDRKVQREVIVEFTKNDFSLKEKELVNLYPTVKDKMTVVDNDKTIAIKFTSRFDLGYQQQNEMATTTFLEQPRKNLKDISYLLSEKLIPLSYLPVLDGYIWDVDTIEVSYDLQLSNQTNIESLKLGKQLFALNGEATEYLGSYVEGDNYHIKFTQPIKETFNMEVYIEETNDMFYLWIIAIIFILIVIGLVYWLYRIRKKAFKDYEEDSSY